MLCDGGSAPRPCPTRAKPRCHTVQGTAGCHDRPASAGGSVLPGSPRGTPPLTPSSSSMISVPMEARVVHLQLLVALTAQRLCALNLQTAQRGANEEQGRSPQDAQPWSPTPPQLVTAASGHQPAPLLLGTNLRGGSPPLSHPHPTPSRTPALTFAGEPVGGDPRERFAAHVAEGGAGMGAGVPVVHTREVLHVELRGLLGHSPAPSVPWDPPLALPPS